MTYVDELKPSTHDDMKDLAKKHGSFETFLLDVQRLADTAWHNVRSQGHDPSSIVGDAEKTIADLEQDVTDAEQVAVEARTKLHDALQAKSDAKPAEPESNEPAEASELTPGPTGEPAPAAQLTPGPTGEGQPVTTPAEPASPSSDGGFPTSNVGVVVNPDPAEGTSVPVEEGTSQPVE